MESVLGYSVSLLLLSTNFASGIPELCNRMPKTYFVTERQEIRNKQHCFRLSKTQSRSSNALCVSLLKAAKWVLGVRVDCVWNMMAHAQKRYFVFRRNGRVHLNRWGRQFIRLLAAEVCASAVVMMDTPCSEVVWRELDTHAIRQFPLHFPSRASPCVITFHLDSTCIGEHTEHWPLTLENQFWV